jgi:hypothetical protein
MCGIWPQIQLQYPVDILGTMARITIESFLDLHSIIEEKYTSGSPIIFRGVPDARYKLIPKVGRVINYSRKLEQDIFDLFRMYGISYLESEPKSDWDLLAIAQHHGLPTRLLDWTYNPLVAAYFAVEENFDSDSAVYAMPAPMILDTKKAKSLFRRAIGVDIFMPSHITRRIAAQSGLFTVHWTPTKPINRNSIDKLIIPNSLRINLRGILYKYAFIEGLSSQTLMGKRDISNG